MQAFLKKIIKSDISGEPLKHGPRALKFWLIAAFMLGNGQSMQVFYCIYFFYLQVENSTFSTCK